MKAMLKCYSFISKTAHCKISTEEMPPKEGPSSGRNYKLHKDADKTAHQRSSRGPKTCKVCFIYC